MRILVDLQGAQTGSRYRGIGRSATSLTQALIRNRGQHEIFILLNRRLENTVRQIKDDFANLLFDEHFIVCSFPSPVRGLVADNGWRMAAAELIREWTIGKFALDVVLITSLFEGAGTMPSRRSADCRRAYQRRLFFTI